MRILVTGAGRGGTNLATELIRNADIVNFTSNVEDRNFFNYPILPENYGTKLATENSGFSKKNIKGVLDKNSDLMIVFVIRNPIDNCLSKIVRGQPKSKGGDSNIDEVASDGTLETSIKAVKHCYNIFMFLYENYRDKLIYFTMEELLTKTDDVVNLVSESLDIENKDQMYDFYKTNKNRYQNKRYGKKKVLNVDLYKDLENNFNGFFKNKEGYVKKIRDEFKNELAFFSYENI